MRDAQGPSPRYGAATAHDSARGVTVLFGGKTEAGFNAETWEWDGVEWSLRATGGPPAGPSSKMAYDSARESVILICAGECPSQTWEWDGNAWVLRDANGPCFGASALAYDVARDVAVLCVACCNGSETWEWNGNNWVWRAAGDPIVSPERAMAYDELRRVTVLFGGVAPDVQQTWEWDGDTWSLRALTGPRPRGHCALAYHASHGACVLFGGDDYVSETWAWDGVQWSRLATAGPSPRCDHAMAYDHARATTVLFGGYESPGAHLGDTWELRIGVLGDVNCDGRADFGDINAFVMALTDPVGYAGQYPDCDLTFADISRDGRVNFGDINPFVRLLTEPGCQVLDFDSGTFNRASKAYQWDYTAQKMAEVSEDTPRIATVALAGSSDGVLTDVVVNSDYHIGPQCNDGGYLFAVAMRDGGNTASGVWRCTLTDDPTAAGNWMRISTDINAKRIWHLESQQLLLASAFLTDRDALYWSDDRGATWTRCTLDGSPWSSEEAKGHFRGWELGQHDGTLLIPQGVWGNSRNMCRSTDGKAWTVVGTAADDRDPGSANNHTHTVGYHSATGRWPWQRGDGIYNRRVLVSDDDGLTWADLIDTVGAAHQQCVGFIDYGDPTYLLAAADDSRGVYLVDVTTGRAAALPFPSKLTESGGYVFLLFEYAGVYYACSFTTHEPGAAQRILVSTDRVNWAAYHTLQADDGGPLRFAGVSADKLVMGLVQDGAYHTWRVLTISPVRMTQRAAALLEPTTTNLVTDDIANCKGTWAGAGRSFPVNGMVYGTNHVRWTFPGDATSSIAAYAVVAPVSLADATFYSWSYCMRGYFGGTGSYLRYRIDASGPWVTCSTLSDRPRGGGLWHRVDGMPNWVAEGGGIVTDWMHRFDITASLEATNVWVGNLDLDCYQCEEGIVTSWMNPAENGGVRADDTLSWPVSLAAGWTTVLTAQFRHARHVMKRANHDYYIISWKKGNATASVWYDISEARLLLDYDPDGSSNMTLLETAALDWAESWHQFRLAVRAESAGTRLSLDYGTGEALHYFSATPMTNLLDQASAMVQNGDGSDHNFCPTRQLPMLLCDCSLYSYSMTDGELEQKWRTP